MLLVVPAVPGWSARLAAAVAAPLAAARTHVGVRRTALFWLDPAAGRLTCVATVADAGPEGWVGETLAAGVGMASRAIAADRAVWTPDLLAEARVPVAPWLRARLEAEGLRAVAAAPVRLGDEVRGALGFLDEPGRRYDAEALEGLAWLAAGLGAALAGAAGAGR
jgi:GAF domain-containing protein